jgi:signal transduction histidine kinase
VHRNQAVIRVRDTGVGIDPIDLPHIFERFYRGDKSRQRAEPMYGNGLGLSICHSIVAAHDGQIVVERSVGKGTTFTVTLPLAATAPMLEPVTNTPSRLP